MTNPQDEFKNARDMYIRYGGFLPTNFFEAISNSRSDREGSDADYEPSNNPWDWTFVFGEDPASAGELIILPLSKATAWGKEKTCLVEAKTFGELKELDPDTYAEIVDILTDRAEWPEFEDFETSSECTIPIPDDGDEKYDGEAQEGKYEEDYEIYLEKARKQYYEYGPYGSRPPRDEDEFEMTDYEQWCFDYYPSALGNENPKTEMHGLIPASIEKEFATLAAGMWDGPYVTYLAKDKEKIIERFEELGFLMVEDDFLIDGAYWGGGDVEGLNARIEWYRKLEEMLEGKGE